MNTFTKFKSAKRFTLAAMALVCATVLASPSVSHALSTAAGTKITNTVTVNYKNTALVAQTAQTATADVTVTMVPSAPNVTPDITTNSVTEGTPTLVTYTVSGTANGKDSYNITSAETPSANMSNVNGTQTITPTSITLAGTSLAAVTVAGSTVTVPLDSSAGPYGATGLVAGAVGTGTLLKIGANTYTVTAITTDAPTNTMALTLNVALNAADVGLPVGTIIGEQKTFAISYLSGAILGAAPLTQTGTATVTSTSTGTPATTSGSTVITVSSLPTSLTITKTVCTATPTVGALACFAGSGNAAPGGTVLYKVVIVNSGSGTAKSVVIDDVIQKYLTYNAGSAKFKVGATGVPSLLNYNDVTMTALTEGAGGYTFTAGPPAVINYAYPANLANGNELVLFYSANVN